MTLVPLHVIVIALLGGSFAIFANLVSFVMIGKINERVPENERTFDTLGGVKWIVPGYFPQMATVDGGIIATSGGSFDPISGTFVTGAATTFDSTGSATGQLPTLPTYSWKAAYQRGSVESVRVPAPTLAFTFSAFSGGNLTNNGTAFVHHSFGLFWCGTGYLGQGYFGPCTQGNGNDIQWGYYPEFNENRCNTAACGPGAVQDFSRDHPEWVRSEERRV